MNITIRPGTEADFPAIIGLINEFAVFQKSADKVSNSLEQMQADAALFKCLVAEDGGQIVGYAAFFFAYYTWSGKNLYLDDLYVKETARGFAIGTRLLHSVIEHARVSGCKKVRWQVSNWNAPAIHFYKKMGATIDDVELNCHLELK